MVHVSISLLSTSMVHLSLIVDDIKFLCLPRIVHVSLSIVHVSLSLIVDMTTLSFSVYLV